MDVMRGLEKSGSSAPLPGVESLMLHFTPYSEDWSKLPVIVSGEGCYVTDDKGNTYIDGLAGLFTTQVGHGSQSARVLRRCATSSRTAQSSSGSASRRASWINSRAARSEGVGPSGARLAFGDVIGRPNCRVRVQRLPCGSRFQQARPVGPGPAHALSSRPGACLPRRTRHASGRRKDA